MTDSEVRGRGGILVRRSTWRYWGARGIGEFVATDTGLGVGIWRAPRGSGEPGLFIRWGELGEVVFGPMSFVARNKDGVGARLVTIDRTPVRQLRAIIRERGLPHRASE